MSLSSCIKQSEYDLVRTQKQELEAQVQRITQQVQQTQAAFQAQQARMLQIINVQSTLQKREEELQKTREELEALKAEFAKFRTQRRSAMTGKKYPYLHLDGGRSLANAEIVAVDPVNVSIRHDGGFLKLTLADSSEELRWEACFDPEEARREERSRFLNQARLTEGRMEEESRKPPPQVKMVSSGNATAAQELRNLITAQRAQLNREYDALKAKNSGALKDCGAWNSNQPEASQLLNDLRSKPAVLGISRLEALRDSIASNLARLRDVGS